MAKKKKNATRKKVATKSTTDAVAKPQYKGTCFVMMPFRMPFDRYYNEIFDPAIRKARLEPIRADALSRPSNIVDDFWQMIQDAKALLAELTTQNANVFYELGLAHAIGKPVILLAETMDHVPFDLRQLRVLLYDRVDPAWGAKLAKEITKAINETLKSRIESVPSIFRTTVESQAPEQDALAAKVEKLESQMRVRGSTEAASLADSCLEELDAVTTLEGLAAWYFKWQHRGMGGSDLARLYDAKYRKLQTGRGS